MPFAVVALLVAAAVPAMPPDTACAPLPEAIGDRARPQALSVFDHTGSLSVRDVVARAGPPATIVITGVRGAWMSWPLDDGRHLQAMWIDTCAGATSAGVRGVTPKTVREGSPEARVRDFYRLKLQPGPDTAQGEALRRSMLGTSLRRALDAHRRLEAACAAAAPAGDKPLMIEGDVFDYATSDGLDRLEETREAQSGDIAWVDMVTALDGYPEVHTQTERVLLRREGDAWVILDVRWNDPHGGDNSVTQRLIDFAADARRHCGRPERQR